MHNERKEMEKRLEPYIAVDRHFETIDSVRGGEPNAEEFDFHSSFFSRNRKTWSHILENRCTVILANAGSGKTAELRQKAKDLRERGTDAFFCRLELLGSGISLESAIEAHYSSALAEWVLGNRRRYFFLDSVDEAKLISVSHFEMAIARFVDAIEHAKHRVTVIISTRPNAWAVYSDRAMLVSRLDLASHQVANFKAVTADPALGDDAAPDNADLDSREENEAEQSPISLVKLVPLNDTQIREFASKSGVSNVDAFIQAIESADADVFASRPSDLLGLIHLWKNDNRIGRYSEVVHSNAERRLEELNESHQRNAIPASTAFIGAATLSATATLTRQMSISIPANTNYQTTIACCDPLIALPTWKAAEIRDLLGRAIFDPAEFGTVSLHLRPTREYLTAHWFAHLLKERKNRRSIESIFFDAPYGTESTVIVPRMKPIVGWLATLDESIRDKVARIDPRVLLEFGDASSLDIGIREELLRSFAKQHNNHVRTRLSLSVREVRRLTDPRLSNTILQLLGEYRDNHDVQRLLLRMIIEGKVPGCSDECERICLNLDRAESNQLYAAKAIGVTNSEMNQRNVINAMLQRSASFNREFFATVVEAFQRRVMTPDVLEKLLRIAAKPERHSVDGLKDSLSAYFEQSTLAERTHILSRLVALLSEKPWHNNDYCQVSSQHAWLLVPAMSLVVDLVETGPATVSSDVLTMLVMSMNAKYFPDDVSAVQSMTMSLLHKKPFAHKAFWHKVKLARARSETPVKSFWPTGIDFPIFDPEDLEDFEYAVNNLTHIDDKIVALDAMYYIHKRNDNDPQMLARIEALVEGDELLELALREIAQPLKKSKEIIELESESQKYSDLRATEEAEQKKQREEWVTRMKLNPDKTGDLSIVSEGKVLWNTIWLAEEVRKKSKSSSQLTIVGWETIEPEFGRRVVDSIRLFCKQMWRLYRPPLRSAPDGDTNHISWTVIIGLSGIEEEAQSDTNWAQRLSDDDTTTAVCYALRELNRLPDWFKHLHQAHRDLVESILLNEILWAITHERANDTGTYLLHLMRWHEGKLAQVIRLQIIELLQRHDHIETRALSDLLTIILKSAEPIPQSFAAFSIRKALTSAQDQQAFWYAASLCLDAEPTIKMLDAWLKSFSTQDESANNLNTVLRLVIGDGSGGLSSQRREFLNVSSLTKIVQLTNRYISPPEASNNNKGHWRHMEGNIRDNHAQLLDLLANIPGRETFDALSLLGRLANTDFDRNRILNLAERRAELDLQGEPWKTSDVAAFSNGLDRNPKTEEELFRIAISRLDDYKLDLECGDESAASLLRKVDDEFELRRVIAGHLRLVANSRYTTASEEELADRTRTDIRFHSANVATRVPVEIKIAGRWQADELTERMENQLIKQYMGEAKHGVFLIVNRSSKRDTKTWDIRQPSRIGFDELIQWLERFAIHLMKTHKSVAMISVIGIDLTKRNSTSQGTVSSKVKRSLQSTKRKHSSKATNDSIDARRKPKKEKSAIAAKRLDAKAKRDK